MNGIIPLWKPRGMTSHDCVQKIRKIYKTKKVGHTGTLDPMVEGVLPICINQATKIVPYLTAMNKTYIAEIQLGVATETEDAHGKVIAEKRVDESFILEKIDSVLQSFQGEIIQIPPLYSAVRVKGKRLYEYARKNIPVERPKRSVTIHHIERLSRLENNNTVFKFKVNCSQGTYIRTLCVDIGKKLGYPAHMSDLIRVEASSFFESETITFKDIERAKDNGHLEKTVVPMLRALQHMDKIEVDRQTKQKVSYGQKLPNKYEITTDDPFLLVFQGQLIAIYEIDRNIPHAIKPVRVFITHK